MSNYYILDRSGQLVQTSFKSWTVWIKANNPCVSTVLETGIIVQTTFTGIGNLFWTTYVTFQDNSVIEFGHADDSVVATNMHLKACSRYGIKNDWEVNGF